MDAIEQIRQRVKKYPNMKCEIEKHRATIFPQDEQGFSVSLTKNGSGYTIEFGDWHEEYKNAESALNAFAFGLSEDCRLKVGYQGRFPHVWLVEEKDEDGNWFPCEWIGCNEMGLLVPSLFWLRKRVVYLQNHWIQSEKTID